MVRHGGRARVFSCFCRVWRSGLKNRPAGHGRCATHTGARLLQPMPNLERRPARQSRPPTAPPGTEGAPRAPAHACYNQCPTWNDNQLGNHALPHCPAGHGRCATRTGARLLQPMPNLERQPARQSRTPPLPRRHGRCATRTGARLLQPMPNLERQPARQSRPPHRPAGHGRCANAHRRTLATTNAELRTTTNSASAGAR